MPCHNCGGILPHETTGPHTRGCNCQTYVPYVGPQHEPMVIHIDSLPGGTGYNLGLDEAKSSVREWHPPCATCEHWQEGVPGSLLPVCGLSGFHRIESDYCSDHTDFDKEDKSDD